LELLKILPEIPERIRQELFLRTMMGSVFVATKGYAAPEVAKAYARAQELCHQLGESPELFTVLRGLWTFHLLQAKLQEARELAKRLLISAQKGQEPSLFLEAHLALGVTSYFMGDLALAREHLEEVILLYNPQQHHSHTLLYGGSDPGVSCLSISAWTLWSLGYPEQALKRSQEVLALARELAHPYSMAFALDFAAGVHLFRREGRATQERAEPAVTLSAREGFPLGLALGTIQQGWALAHQGHEEEGVALIEQGITTWRATGAEPWPYFLALLAEAYWKVGRIEEGSSVLTEAMALINKNGERFYEAELYRLKGELLLHRDQHQVSKSNHMRLAQKRTFRDHRPTGRLALRAPVGGGKSDKICHSAPFYIIQ
jgi:predicted ATPase